MNPGADQFRVAFVCTGNRFRSPLACAIFRMEVAPLHVPVEVESFGLLDLGAAPVLKEALEFGASLGVDLSSHRSRAVQAGALHAADLVVGFERIHLATAVVDGGARRESTYTLPELVALLEGADEATYSGSVEQARKTLAIVSGLRQTTKMFTGVPEIADPLGQPRGMQEEIAGRVADLTRALARRLFRSSD